MQVCNVARQSEGVLNQRVNVWFVLLRLQLIQLFEKLIGSNSTSYVYYGLFCVIKHAFVVERRQKLFLEVVRQIGYSHQEVFEETLLRNSSLCLNSSWVEWRLALGEAGKYFNQS